MSRDALLEQTASELGYRFDGTIKIGGNYTPMVQDGSLLYISGQIPRVGDTVMVAGKVGLDVDLAQAQLASKICTMRALALIKQQFGSLDKIQSVLKMNVYVNCCDDFTQQSEVSDGASDLLFAILGDSGIHSRTSVGVYQLPKNASVEIDFIIKIK
ncbi:MULTISPECIES: RidA family protein [unclassified Moraxella]|uniref:RidA family protein n=1 Tax=unclassified Moraxella TaxID=2685852 RepID=UPI003AF971C7